MDMIDGTVTSKDGTTIAYDRRGSGPAVVLVDGGLVDRSENAPLAAELATRFTACTYDRRGREIAMTRIPTHSSESSTISRR